jgi:hypothetical protein
MTGRFSNFDGPGAGLRRDAVRRGDRFREAETNTGLKVIMHHGIWQVRMDGGFHGDYHQEEPARAAAALLRRSLP